MLVIVPSDAADAALRAVPDALPVGEVVTGGDVRLID